MAAPAVAAVAKKVIAYVVTDKKAMKVVYFTELLAEALGVKE